MDEEADFDEISKEAEEDFLFDLFLSEVYHLPILEECDYVEGRASPEVVARVESHLSECEGCRKRVVELRKSLPTSMMARAAVRMLGSWHPRVSDLGQWMDDVLPPKKKRLVSDHIERCPECQADIEAVKQGKRDRQAKQEG